MGLLPGPFAFEAGLLVEVEVELFFDLGEDLCRGGPCTILAVAKSCSSGKPGATRPYRTAVNDGTCLGKSGPAGKTLHITPIAVPVLSMLPRPVRVWSPMKQPTFAWPVANGVAAERDEHLAVVVAQVAVRGDRPEVDPLADVGVAQEALVVLVRVAVDDASPRPRRRSGSSGRSSRRPADWRGRAGCRGRSSSALRSG